MPYYYTQQSDIESYLGVSLTGNGVNAYNLLRQPIQDTIDQFCNRSWAFSNPCIENFDALSTVGRIFLTNNQFFPKYPPISTTIANNSYPRAQGIISVTINDASVDMNYVVSYGTHIRLSSSFPSVLMSNPLGYKQVQIQYNSDAAQNVPQPVKLAAVQWIARLIQTGPDSGREPDSVMAGTIQAKFKDDLMTDMSDAVRMILNLYRLPSVDRF